MIRTHEYLMPEYYPDFACKMGDCRASCCEGWQVSLSMDEYFRMVGMDCPEDLRRELDCALYVLERRDSAKYAEVAHKYDGNCRLRMEDGRCALHAHLGEGALPDICRLYPRALRSEGGYECSCTNSCEAVLEMLWRYEEPLKFIKRSMPSEPPKQIGESFYRQDIPCEMDVRMRLIAIVQDRSMPMPHRLMKLGSTLRALDPLIRDKNEAGIRRVCGAGGVAIAVSPHADLKMGLQVIEALTDRLDLRSKSVRRFGEEANAYFGREGDMAEKYEAACAHFERIAPKADVWMEHMLVNHMFFTRYPFSDGPESLQDEFIALCAVYTLMRYLGVGWMADKDDVGSLIDVAAAVFRLVDHTAFHRYSARILREMGMDAPETISAIVNL